MAIMDSLLTFSGTVSAAGAYSGQSITTTAVSTNVIDLAAFRDMGVNDDDAIEVLVLVMTTFTGGTSLQVTFQGSVDNSTFTDYVSSPVILTAALLAGRELFRIKVPAVQNGVSLPRYLRLNYTVVGTMTAGAVWAGLIIDRQAFVMYPNAISNNYI